MSHQDGNKEDKREGQEQANEQEKVSRLSKHLNDEKKKVLFGLNQIIRGWQGR